MTERLLPAIDMKPDTERVDDQRTTNTCVAHAATSAIELCYKRAGQPIDLSRAYLYNGLAKFARSMGIMDGAQYGGLVLTLNKYGLCREETMPYLDYDYDPSAEAVAEAKQLFPAGATAFYGCSNLHDIKVSLNQGKPVMLTIRANNGFAALTGPWREHTWDFSEPMFGMHAVLCIGYDDAVGRLLCENSWGPQWGDGGFFGCPYEAVTSNSVVLDGYHFTKLPVGFVAMEGYVDAGLPVYDAVTQLLTLPRVSYSPPNWGTPKLFHNVVLRLTLKGTVEVNSPFFSPGNGCYFLHKSFDDKIRLGVDRVMVGDVEYNNVMVMGEEMFELVSIGVM